jgi:hypothetical protein
LGRWTSAVFAAGAVAALALLAWRRYGTLVGWGAGFAVALQVDLFETAHYMKEDPAMVFGIALSLFAADLWWTSPGRRTLRFLAVACGLAAAGKYLGIMVLVFALPMVIWCRAADATLARRLRLKLFGIAFGITFLACNLPLFATKLSSPFRSIGQEVQGVAGGHRGITRQIPHGEYLETLHENAPRLVLILAGLYLAHLLVSARRRTVGEWVTILFPLAYLATISCSPKIADRYLLPVNVLLPFLAMLGVAEIGRTLDSEKLPARRMLSYAAVFGLACWLAYSEWPAFRRSFDGYTHDDPTEAAAWVRANLPPDAVIAEDHRISLSPTKSDKIKSSKKKEGDEEKENAPPVLAYEPSKDARVPQKVYSPNFAPDLGSLDKLRKCGVTHVAICKQSYGRYFKDETKPRESAKTGYDERREFYAEVLEEGELLKSWPSGTITYLQPGIKIFRITPAKLAPQ